jgi:hypothetical protein
VLEDWVAQSSGELGDSSGPVVGDLIARKIAAELDAIPAGDGEGAAVVLVYLPFAGQPDGPPVWLCADLRSKSRSRPSDPRQLRLGVEVAISDIENQESSAAEKTAAFDMLMSVRRALTCTKVKQELQHAGKQQLAGAIRPTRSRTLLALNSLSPSPLAGWPDEQR